MVQASMNKFVIYVTCKVILRLYKIVMLTKFSFSLSMRYVLCTFSLHVIVKIGAADNEPDTRSHLAQVVGM